MSVPFHQRVAALVCVIVMINASVVMVATVVFDGPAWLFFASCAVLLVAANIPFAVTGFVAWKRRQQRVR
jgi:hypothetical protein